MPINRDQENQEGNNVHHYCNDWFLLKCYIKIVSFACGEKVSDGLGIPPLFHTLPTSASSFCSPVQHPIGFIPSGYVFLHHLGHFSGTFQDFCIKYRGFLIPQFTVVVENLTVTLFDVSWEWGQARSCFTLVFDKIMTREECPEMHNTFYGHLFKDTHGQV